MPRAMFDMTIYARGYADAQAQRHAAAAAAMLMLRCRCLEDKRSGYARANDAAADATSCQQAADAPCQPLPQML